MFSRHPNITVLGVAVNPAVCMKGSFAATSWSRETMQLRWIIRNGYNAAISGRDGFPVADYGQLQVKEE